MTILNLNGPTGRAPRSKRAVKAWMGVGLVIAVLGIGSTFASTITINEAKPIEFGQGVQKTVYCGGTETTLTLVPVSGFANAHENIAGQTAETPALSAPEGPGDFYFSGIKVTNIPDACSGKDFIFSAYDNTSLSEAVVINRAGGTELISPTVLFVKTENGYYATVSKNRDGYNPEASLVTLSPTGSTTNGFILNFPQSNTDGAFLSVERISKIVVESQDDTFTNITPATSLSSFVRLQ